MKKRWEMSWGLIVLNLLVGLSGLVIFLWAYGGYFTAYIQGATTEFPYTLLLWMCAYTLLSVNGIVFLVRKCKRRKKDKEN